MVLDLTFLNSLFGSLSLSLCVCVCLSLCVQLIAQDSKLAAGQIVSRFATSSWDVIRWTIQSHGVSRLWRGAGITMLRDGIGVAAFFAAKRAVEETLGTADPHRHPPTFATSVLAGGLAGLAFG